MERGGGGGGGRAESLTRDKLATQRRNLLGITKMCVKSLVDKAAFEAVEDDCLHLNNFCTVMEHVFTHRIQVRWTLFAGSDSPSFWQLISRVAPPISVTSVQDMETIQSDIGRCRAWIRLMLVQKRLSDFMSYLLSRQDILRGEYLPGAFLLSDELTEIAGTVKCLDTIDFNLCLREHDFDFRERKDIDYSTYLTFHQSASSQVDDFIEEQKLNRRVSFPWQPEVWAGSSGEGVDGEGEGGSMREDTPAQLRELLKTERDQKNYFEELVSVRDNQVSRLQLELASAGEEHEKERAELEVVILELQQQLAKKQEELRALQQLLSNNCSSQARTLSHPPPPSQDTLTTTSKPSLPPSSTATGGRLRNSSFSMFSGLLGSRTST